MKCPHCGSTNIKQYRHPNSEIMCNQCNFILRDEGKENMNLGDSILSLEAELKSIEDNVLANPISKEDRLKMEWVLARKWGSRITSKSPISWEIINR